MASLLDALLGRADPQPAGPPPLASLPTPLARAVMSNPVGTETTQSMGMPRRAPFDELMGLPPGGSPMMATDLDRAHGQLAQAMQTAPMMAMGMTGGAPGEASLVPAIRHRGKIYQAPDDYPSHLGALQAVPVDQRAAAMGDANNRGFVTDAGKYLDRFDSADYAKDNGLIARDAPYYAHTHNEMIAEWLQSYRDWFNRDRH